MVSPVYHFGDFRLNPLARELSQRGKPIALAASGFDCLVYLIEHRERPVGKDELVSAVWGRTDVSDNLIAQTIVRLRRVLGDAGNEQRCIKTIARVGYRWMLDTTVTFQTPTVLGGDQTTLQSGVMVDEVHADVVTHAPSHWKRTWVFLVAVLLLTLISASSYWGWKFYHPKPVMHFEQSAAIVLPAEVDAPDDWKWLHLGLMDLISAELREARIPTESSRDVLNLLNQTGEATNVGLSPFALVVSTHVELADSRWRVHLDAKSRDGRSWQAEASSDDVLAAARAASNLLLIQLGFGARLDKDAAIGSQQEYLLRIQAAQLANEPGLARELIDKAPSALVHTPELAFAEAQLYCDEGKLDPCEQTLNDLRQQLSGVEQPMLRGKVLTALWYFYNRKHRFAEGEAALSEAVRWLQGQKDPEALATAYLDRSHLMFFQGNLDGATSDLGLARINYMLAGETVGQAKVDYGMGLIAVSRGQFNTALPLFQHAYEAFQRMGVRVLAPVALDGLAQAHRMLLQFPEELAATDRFWPLDPHFLDDYARHQLSITRAIALTDNGRTVDAGTLLEQLLAQVDRGQEMDLQSQINMLLAKQALERGDNSAALALITTAMAGPGLADDADKRDYAEACLIQATALQRAGNVQQLKRTVSAMEAWAGQLSEPDDAINIWVMRVKAVQAWTEGNRDQAVDQLKQAMALANKAGVPELIVSVGLPYAKALLDTGHVDQAVAVSGQLSAWSNLDWRAAWVEASVYKALGQTSAWEGSHAKAQRLAGDRTLQEGHLAFAF